MHRFDGLPPHQTGPLDRGSHSDPDAGRCAMEQVAAIAGESHSDAPDTADPVLAAFTRALNDGIEDPWIRGIVLAPRLHALVRTATHPEVTDARAYALADATLRRFAAEACRRAGDHEAALSLASAEPVTDRVGAILGRLRITALPTELRTGPLRAAEWVLTMAARGTTPARVWAGAAARAARDAWNVGAEQDPPERWAFAAAEVLDALIELPRRNALVWDDAPHTAS